MGAPSGLERGTRGCTCGRLAEELLEGDEYEEEEEEEALYEELLLKRCSRKLNSCSRVQDDSRGLKSRSSPSSEYSSSTSLYSQSPSKLSTLTTLRLEKLDCQAAGVLPSMADIGSDSPPSPTSESCTSFCHAGEMLEGDSRAFGEFSNTCRSPKLEASKIFVFKTAG